MFRQRHFNIYLPNVSNERNEIWTYWIFKFVYMYKHT